MRQLWGQTWWVWGFYQRLLSAEVREDEGNFDNKPSAARRHLHTALFRWAVFGLQVPWTISMSEEMTLPSHVFTTARLCFSQKNFGGSLFPKRSEVRRTRQRRWGHLLPAWKAELILPSEHLNFAIPPRSLGLVVTLQHWDFPMNREGREPRVGGSVCVGGSASHD